VLAPNSINFEWYCNKEACQQRCEEAIGRAMEAWGVAPPPPSHDEGEW